MKFFSWIEKYFQILRQKKLLIFSVIFVFIVIIVAVGYVLIVRPSHVSKEKIEKLEISLPDGALNPGNSVISYTLSAQSTQYTNLTALSSFVGVPYVLKWKSGTNSMSRLPVMLSVPIPSKYYLGTNDVNVEIFEELQSGNIQTLYGGEIEEINGNPYITVLTYFPGIIAMRLKTSNTSYGLIPLNKISSTHPNLVVIPGENSNFSGNLPNFGINFWVQKFPDYNIYLFSYPLSSYRNYAFTSQMMSYFGTSGFDSYTQYVGSMFSNMLGTLRGKTFIVAQGIGGLIARYAVESAPTAGNVKKVVLFNTPNLGTSLASAYTVSNFYNAGPNFLSKEFQISSNSINYILNSAITYLYAMNFFAKDISPNSAFLKRLNEIPVPTNISFITIAGTNSGISLKNFGSLKSDFPEFLNGEGDGVVSTKSALGFGTLKFEFPYSFSDIFIHDNVMSTLAKILSATSTSSIAFKSDNISQTTVSTKSENISSISTRTMTYKYLSSGDYIVKPALPDIFIKKIYSVSVSKARKIAPVSGGIYLIASDAVYYLSLGGKSIIYSGNIRFSNVYSDNLYIVTDNWQILKFNGFSSTLEGTITDRRYRSIFIAGNKIYTLTDNSTSTTLFSNDKALVTIPGLNASMWYSRSSNSFIITTNSYIAIYDLNNMVGSFFESVNDLMKKIDMGSEKSLLPFTSSLINDKTLYLLSSNYMLMAIDLNTKGVQLIGNDNIGNEKIVPYESYLIITGSDGLNFYDTVNRVKIPVYQNINSKLIDASSYGTNFYLLVLKGGIYEFETYQKH